MEITSVHVTAGLHPSSGGTSRSVPASVSELAKIPGLNVRLISESRAADDVVLPSDDRVRTVLSAIRSGFLGRLSLEFRKDLDSMLRAENVSLIHTHGIWLPVNHHASQAGRRLKIPVVVHPHGMLEPWSLEYKYWKKKLAMLAFQRRDLDAAAALVATSESESQSFRDLGLKQPIAIVPNGVSMEGLTFDRGSFVSGPKNIALFLSRIHPKKGIPDLLRAWADLRRPDWLLRIVGPEEVGHLAECESLARALGISSEVEFIGEVNGRAKAVIFEEASLFVLPTYSENFGIVVAEALSYGLPVITTHGTPWQDLVSHGCGWWVPCGEPSVKEALAEAMGMSWQQRLAMGKRGQAYVARYTWQRNAEQTSDFYRWLLGLGPLPPFVRID